MALLFFLQLSIGDKPRTIYAQDEFPTAPWELISLTNSYRASIGNPQLEEHNILNAVAQTTAEIMAANQSCAHIDDVRGRIAAAGYGSGLVVWATENIICSIRALGDPYADYNRWGDPDHMLMVRNGNYQHVGAAAARGANNTVYYVLIAAYTGGASRVTPILPGGATPTRALIFAVQTATPRPDGKVVHVVQPGQALWSIATAYGVKIADIVALNNLAPNNPIIYPGQELIVLIGFTPTASPTITETPQPATRTPTPTETRQPTHTPTLTPTVTPKPFFADLPQSLDSQTLGIGIIILCSLGLLALVISTLRSRGSA